MLAEIYVPQWQWGKWRQMPHFPAVQVEKQALWGKPESQARGDLQFIVISSSQEEICMGQ